MNEEMSTVEYWELIYKGKSNAQPGGSVSDRFAQVMEFFRERPETVLEVGAGYATFAKRLRSTYREKAVSALDFSPEAAERSGFKPYHVADACNTGLPSKSFDTIVCCQTMGYLADPDAFMREMSRIGKRLLLTVSNGVPRYGTRHDWNFETLQAFLERHGTVTALRSAQPALLLAEVLFPKLSEVA